MSHNKNKRREFTEAEWEESQYHYARQVAQSDYWNDVRLKREAVLQAVKDGVLKPREIRFFRNELKKLEN